MTSSRRRETRSRSPRRADDRRDRSPPRDRWRSSSNRDYRDRDYDDRYCDDRYYDDRFHDRRNDSTRRQQGHESAPTRGGQNVTGQNPSVTTNIFNYGAPPMAGTQLGHQPAGNRRRRRNDRRRDDDRGRSRGARQHESSQASQPRSGLMPPPPPRPRLSDRTGQSGRARGDRPSGDDLPKMQIPDKLRDKCGACKKDQDIRFCPEPNTEDGRTKICPVCDTSKHAWYQCPRYDSEDDEMKWIVLWINRRCLPTMVHSDSLNDVFLAKIHLEDSNKTIDERVAILNRKAGPLSPDFVSKLMSPEATNDEARVQLADGRRLPWQLERNDIESNMRRPDKAIEDPATREMQLWKQIKGTRSDLVPKARGLEHFRELERQKEKEKEMQRHEKERNLNKAGTGPLGVSSCGFTRKHSKSKIARIRDEMKVTCRNCGADGHNPDDCPSPCPRCGTSMQQHVDTTLQCTYGCLCREDAGHTAKACGRLCRLCIMEDPQSTTPIMDCKKHCHVHVCNKIGQEAEHATCPTDHENCQECHSKHWGQDCPLFLKTICPLQTCRATKCAKHCLHCGGMGPEGLLRLCPQKWGNSPAVWQARMAALLSAWHTHLHAHEWEREEVPGQDLRNEPWARLRCRNNPVQEAVIDNLGTVRTATWVMAVQHLSSGYEEGGLEKAIEALSMPECRWCFTLAYEPGSGAEFDTRQPGVLNEFGRDRIARFKSLLQNRQ